MQFSSRLLRLVLSIKFSGYLWRQLIILAERFSNKSSTSASKREAMVLQLWLESRHDLVVVVVGKNCRLIITWRWTRWRWLRLSLVVPWGGRLNLKKKSHLAVLTNCCIKLQTHFYWSYPPHPSLIPVASAYNKNSSISISASSVLIKVLF